MMAARTGRLPVIELLLAKGAKINEREKLRGTTALMWAAANSNADGGAPAHCQGRGDQRALRHHGARAAAVPRRDRRSRIQEFIDGTRPGGTVVEVDAADAKVSNDPNARAEADKRLAKSAKSPSARFPVPTSRRRQSQHQAVGRLTPLQFAVREGSMETVKTLAEGGRGRQSEERGSVGRRCWSPLTTGTTRSASICSTMAPIRTSPTGRLDTALYRNRQPEHRRRRLSTRKPDMDHSRLHQAAAHGACESESAACARAPRRAPCSRTSGCSKRAPTPFLRAAQSGDIVLLKLLLEHGADASMTTDSKVTR